MSHLNCPNRLEIMQEAKKAARDGKSWADMPKEYDNKVEGMHWRIGFFQELEAMEKEQMAKEQSVASPKKATAKKAAVKSPVAQKANNTLENFFEEAPTKLTTRKGP